MFNKTILLTLAGLFLLALPVSAANIYDLTWLSTHADYHEVSPSISNSGKKVIWTSYYLYDTLWGEPDQNEMRINYYYKKNTTTWLVRDIIGEDVTYFDYSYAKISGDGSKIAFIAKPANSNGYKLYLMNTKGKLLETYDFIDLAEDRYSSYNIDHTSIIDFAFSNDANEILARVQAYTCASESATPGEFTVAVNRNKDFAIDIGLTKIAIDDISGKGNIFTYLKTVNELQYIYYASFPKKATSTPSGIQLALVSTNKGCTLNKLGTKAACAINDDEFFIITLSNQQTSSYYDLNRDFYWQPYLTNKNWVVMHGDYKEGVNLVRADGTKLFRTNKQTREDYPCDDIAIDIDGDIIICESYSYVEGSDGSYASSSNIYRLKINLDNLKPKGLKVTNKSGNKARLTWTAVRGAARYKIKVNNKIYTSTKNKITISNLKSGTEYTYKVRSVFSNDNKSDWSKSKTLTYN